MDVKNDLGGGKPTLLIAEDEESNYLLPFYINIVI